MRIVILLVLLYIVSFAVSAQTKVSGMITDKKGNPLVGVNIYFKDTYDGTTSGFDGRFNAETNVATNPVLIASYLGYETFQYPVAVDTASQLNITLQESRQDIEAITITAGSFAAGDEGNATVLNPMDIYTTAGSLGDAMGAMVTLPGLQKAADDGRLLVRGGEAYETKTVIDGLLAGKPYYSKVPDMPTRGRFSPSLFSGTMFSTGGYSAEYGQALSSVLILNSNDLATKDVTSISLMSLGGGLDYTRSFKNSSLSVSGNYFNLTPYYNMVESKHEWTKPSETLAGSVVYRQKTAKNGLLKVYFTGDAGKLEFKSDAGVNNQKYTTKLNNNNYYGNITLKQPLSSHTSVKTGVSFTNDHPDIQYGFQTINTSELNIEGRVALVHDVKGIKLSYGLSNTYTKYLQKYRQHPDSGLYKPSYNENLYATFMEAEIPLTKCFAFRPGVRYEYSNILNKWNLAPRLAVAFCTGKNSQLSASYGHFYQTPQSDVLKFSDQVNFERADHYILGFQTGEVDKRLFRIESFYKKYSQLIRHNGDEFYLPDFYNNSGDGEAKGVDVFWRDSKSIKKLEYWLSYSYLDTKRKYKSFDHGIKPDFISDHNFSVVSKYFLSAINTQIGATFSYSSARNWYEKQPQQIITHKGEATHDLSMNVSYLTHLFDHYTVVHLSVSNVLGVDNVYGYRRGPLNNQDGKPVYLPSTKDVKRFVFLGVFITLD